MLPTTSSGSPSSSSSQELPSGTRRTAKQADSNDGSEDGKTLNITHIEDATPASDARHGFKVSKTGGGDAAMALFNSLDEVHEPYTDAEERRVIRKIDWIILPQIAICYAFFYIDK